MGAGRFDPADYSAFVSSTAGLNTRSVYSAGVGTSARPTYDSIHADLDPLKVKLDAKGVRIRESRDSVDNPLSTPVIVALDVTGSMGHIADNIAREGLGTLFTGILDRKPVTDPHLMFMGVGDANYDRAPLQVSQFEADKRIIEQLASIYLEHGGGGNRFESYNLPWYFAAYHTAHDSIEKRGKRGYLFTVGDEEAPHDLTKDQIKTFLGDTPQEVPTTKELLELAQRKYDVFHVIVKQGSHASANFDRVLNTWKDLLGQRVIVLDDYTKLAETIVSAIEVAEGRDADDSAKAWGGSSRVIYDAVKNLPKGRGPTLLPGPSA